MNGIGRKRSLTSALALASLAVFVMSCLILASIVIQSVVQLSHQSDSSFVLRAQPATQSAMQQQHDRLRLHADESVFGHQLSIAAVCDTGNGAMVYVLYRGGLASSTEVAVTSVPNGCAKMPGNER